MSAGSGHAPPAGRISTWVHDLALGARLTAVSGRSSWTRTALTAIGVGLGVAMLLLVASIPAMLSANRDRNLARTPVSAPAGTRLAPADDTVVIRTDRTQFRGDWIKGIQLQPDGAHPPLPPGVAAAPGPGEMVVSPGLRELLDTAEGKLLAPRLPYRIIGVLGDDGLGGPRELFYVAGRSDLVAGDSGERITRFGVDPPAAGPELAMVLVLALALLVMLLPVAVFVATALRFGAAARERQLAALRLVGADAAMTRRVAAGEALTSALLGVLVGAAFLLGVRQLLPLLNVDGASVFAHDVRPSPALSVVVLLGVPAAAVALSVLALRRILIEPLGVVRRAASVHRRLWWRLALPAAGIGLLVPALGRPAGEPDDAAENQILGATALLLISVAILLPWLTEVVVARLGRGPVSWQLAVRRLQLDSGAAVRSVSGVAVAVAGVIALQPLIAAHNTGGGVADPVVRDTQMTVTVATDDRAAAAAAADKLRATPGVDAVYAAGVAALGATADTPQWDLFVADCPTLRRQFALSGCADGDAFLAGRPGGAPAPGQRVSFASSDGTPTRWTVPRDSRAFAPAPGRPAGPGVLATPAALGGAATSELFQRLFLTLRPGDADAVEHVRNTVGVTTQLTLPTVTDARVGPAAKTPTVRTALTVGAVMTLLLIGASLLVNMVEQLRERRKQLAMLVAVGARRRNLSLSVLWQTAIPVGLGLLLAGATGIGLGAAMLRVLDKPVTLDWLNVAAILGAGVLTVVLVTALSLPPLWRAMRPSGLRAE